MLMGSQLRIDVLGVEGLHGESKVATHWLHVVHVDRDVVESRRHLRVVEHVAMKVTTWVMCSFPS